MAADTAYELVRRGELPSLRLGRRIVVPVHLLRAMLDGDGSHRLGTSVLTDPAENTSVLE